MAAIDTCATIANGQHGFRSVDDGGSEGEKCSRPAMADAFEPKLRTDFDPLER